MTEKILEETKALNVNHLMKTIMNESKQLNEPQAQKTQKLPRA
jgi:hypothetical protein